MHSCRSILSIIFLVMCGFGCGAPDHKIENNESITDKEGVTTPEVESSPETEPDKYVEPAILIPEPDNFIPPYVYPRGGGNGGVNNRCGNNKLESGEQCDTAGESATCDKDCTAVKCGDGIINETAGEECEIGDGASDPNCTAQCRFPLRAFKTSTGYTGNLVSEANSLGNNLISRFNCSADNYIGGPFTNGNNNSGVDAADCLCRERAASQNDELRCADGTFGCWKAWIADSTDMSAPLFRFNMADKLSIAPIYQVDGLGNPDFAAPIATGGWVDLIVCSEADGNPPEIDDICLDDPGIQINGWLTEKGVRGSGNSWTHASVAGTEFDPTVLQDASCLNWSDTVAAVPENLGNCGSASGQGVFWTGSPIGVLPFGFECSSICTASLALYCFEDP